MFDVEPLILEELERLSPLDEGDPGDWDAILAHAIPRRRARRAAIRTVLALAVVLAVVAPAVAFSASVRSFLGLGDPAPRYDQARLRAEAELPEGLVARIWSAPSTQGGACMFFTYDRANSPLRPKEMSGGGFCSRVGALPLPRGGMFWSLGTGPGRSFVLSGVADPALHVSQMTLRWHGGSQQIATHDGYFIASVPVAANPPFSLLPFDLVATNEAGETVATHRFPASALYLDYWKQVEAKLKSYQHAHGCSKTVIWHCRSR